MVINGLDKKRKKNDGPKWHLGKAVVDRDSYKLFTNLS